MQAVAYMQLLETVNLTFGARVTADIKWECRICTHKISYTQILALCNRVAVFFSDKVLIGDMSKSVAKNAALSNVSKFYERAVASDWSLIHADIDYVNKKLEFFITRILNKDISILKDVASVENIKKWEKRDVDYSRRIGRSTD